MDQHEVREEWTDRSGAYSPAYYAYYGPDEASEWVRARLDERVAPDAPVLELGCSSGRHLAHLHDHGYERLAGVELNGEAFEVMAEVYPDLAAAGTFHHAAIEEVVESAETDRFAATFSVETLQHVHPDAAWVYDELVRVTDDLLVTVENEGGDGGPGGVNYVEDSVPLYYRDWQEVFTDRGCRAVAVASNGRDTMRAFQVP